MEPSPPIVADPSFGVVSGTVGVVGYNKKKKKTKMT